MKLSPNRTQGAATKSHLVATASLAIFAAVMLLILLHGWGATTVTQRLDPSRIVHLEGSSYQYKVDEWPAVLGLVPSDDPRVPAASRLVLREDDKAFGRPHSRHDAVATSGGGRYSHWLGNLYFSTPDGTDPRTNSRVYTIDVRYAAPTWLVLTSLILLAFTVSSGIALLSNWKKDVLATVVLIAVAGILTALLLQASDYPAVLNSTDGGNIGGWVAGHMFPDRLASDFLVGDGGNTEFYVSAFLPVVRALGLITNDLGTAYLWTLVPILLVQMTGFYHLGRAMTGNRLWAAVLALMTCTPIWIWGYNDLFGAHWVPLVRMTYDAVLPWLILLFWVYGSRSSILPLLLALCGLSIYLHPVSAPSGAAGLFLASLALLNRDESLWRLIGFLVLGGAAFVLIAVPFAIPFLSSFSGGGVAADTAGSTVSAEAMEMFRRANGAVYYDAFLALRTFIVETGGASWPVWFIGIAGLTIVPLLNPKKRRLSLFLALFLAGCLIASVGVCALDQAITTMLGRAPFQLDLIRGLRLAVVPLLIGFVLCLAEVQRWLATKTRYRPAASAMGASAILIIAAWWTAYPNRISDQIGLAALTEDYRRQSPDATAMMEFLREKPVDGTVLPLVPPTLGLAVRYAALQPIAFIRNDLNALFYSGSERRLLWTELNSLSEDMQADDEAASVAAFRDLLQRSMARYVLVAPETVPEVVLAAVLESGTLIARFGTLSLVDTGTM